MSQNDLFLSHSAMRVACPYDSFDAVVICFSVPFLSCYACVGQFESDIVGLIFSFFFHFVQSLFDEICLHFYLFSFFR